MEYGDNSNCHPDMACSVNTRDGLHVECLSQVAIPKVVVASQPQQLEWGSLIFNPFQLQILEEVICISCVCVSIALHIMWLLNRYLIFIFIFWNYWYLILSTLWMLVFGWRICQISLCRLCFMNLCCNIVILIIYFWL